MNKYSIFLLLMTIMIVLPITQEKTISISHGNNSFVDIDNSTIDSFYYSYFRGSFWVGHYTLEA